MHRHLTSALALLLGSGLVAAGCSGGSSGGGSASVASALTAPAPVTSSATSPTTTASGSGPISISPATQGTFSLLTYNVAGLPQGLSSSSPATNTRQISPKLDTYDIVLAQEDFTYHTDLARDAHHPFQSLPLTQFTTPVNDGLNRFSRYPFVDHQRVRWANCNGWVDQANDCLSSKGFSLARHQVAPGVVIDVYNLHADAGGSNDDERTRTLNFAQLRRFIQTASTANAVIVAGDTNLKYSRPADEQTLLDFMGATGLTDAARTLGMPEHLDRVLFRSSPDVQLTPILWRVADEMKDASGNDLSDHEAIHVDFDWRQ